MIEHNKPKVVIMTADSSVGGGSSHILGLLGNLNCEDFYIYLICPKGYLSDEARKIKYVKIYNVPFASQIDVRSIIKLNKAINTIRLDHYPFGKLILHSHGTRAGFFSLFVRDAIYIYTEHLYVSEYRLKSKIRDCIQRRVMQKVYNNSNKIIAVSRAVGLYLQSRGVSKNKIVVIPNGIEVYKSTKPIKISNRAPIIGSIGSLNWLKGHRYLIDAMSDIVKKYPLATLEVIGDGEEKTGLLELIKSKNLQKNVTLLGKKTDSAKFTEHWDVFVLPSLSESFGIVTLEAMRKGIPVVASRVGGVPEIIRNGQNGLLVEPRNKSDIASAILKIIDNPVLAAKFKREGMTTVQKYDWKKVIKDIELIYRGI